MHRIVVVGCLLGLSSACPNDIPTCSPDDPTCVVPADVPPRIYVDPPFGVGFTCVTIGCDETRHMRIENRGGGVVRLALVRLGVDSSADFSLFAAGADGNASDAALPVPEAQAAIAAGEGMDLVVRYTPSDGVGDDGKVWIDWYDGNLVYEDAHVARIEIPVSSRVLGNAAATTQIDALDFGYVPVGSSSTLPYTVQNDGSAVLQVGPATLDASSSSAYSVLGDDVAYVNPGESTTLNVQFRPTTADAAFGSLVVATNDPTRTQIVVGLAGTSIADPRIALVGEDDHLVDFAQVRVDQERTREIVVMNLGGEALEVTPRLAQGSSAGYSVESQGGGSRVTIHPLQRAQLTIALRPAYGGPLPGRLVLGTNDPVSPEVDVDLTGYGAAPQAVVEPAGIEFGQVVQGWVTTAQSVSIHNGGTGDLEISGVSFEVGSSSQIQLAGVPTLPVKLGPDDEPLQLSVFVTATTVGEQTATLLVQTDQIGEGVLRIPVHASVVTCEVGCPVANGTPDCSAGRCDIGSCLPTWHDADLQTSSGCECQEDRVGSVNADIGAFCGVGLDLGTMNDSGSPKSLTTGGTLHISTDVDLFFFRANDTSQFLDDDYGAQVDLLNAPPGLQLCTRFVSAGNGCGGENQRVCGQTSYRGRDHGINDDSEDVTIWVEWAPGAEPMCATYQIHVKADGNF